MTPALSTKRTVRMPWPSCPDTPEAPLCLTVLAVSHQDAAGIGEHLGHRLEADPVLAPVELLLGFVPRELHALQPYEGMAAGQADELDCHVWLRQTRNDKSHHPGPEELEVAAFEAVGKNRMVHAGAGAVEDLQAAVEAVHTLDHAFLERLE